MGKTTTAPGRNSIRGSGRTRLAQVSTTRKPIWNYYGAGGRRGGGGRDDNEIRTVLSLCSVDEDEVDQKNPPTLLGQRFLSIVKKKKGGGERKKEEGKRKRERRKKMKLDGT